MRRPALPAPGTELALPLLTGERSRTNPQAMAVVTVLADVRRDLARHIPADRADPLRAVAEGTLVDVRVGNRMVLPGAWVRGEELADLERRGTRQLGPADLRMPAVVLGTGAATILAWGETIWPLPFDGTVEVPEACRPGVHSRAQLRRLVLCALDRREDVGLTLWADPGFEVPWHDVRLVPRARWWFELAQVPGDMRYADAARAQGVPVERLLGATQG